MRLIWRAEFAVGNSTVSVRQSDRTYDAITFEVVCSTCGRGMNCGHCRMITNILSRGESPPESMVISIEYDRGERSSEEVFREVDQLLRSDNRRAAQDLIRLYEASHHREFRVPPPIFRRPARGGELQTEWGGRIRGHDVDFFTVDETYTPPEDLNPPEPRVTPTVVMEEPTWKTKDGRLVKVSGMDDTHLANSIKMIETALARRWSPGKKHHAWRLNSLAALRQEQEKRRQAADAPPPPKRRIKKVK